ncbi:pyocin knob domain-containing protein [Microbacterium lacticum]|uniref:pyocin knob domain-containing protein n=1 Tax=Microbacterium lacticum TaxID=33885 RepID=UPI001F5602C2|nr:pyocin knob domain-containing protein [Microbacterium lacticum]
MATVTNTVGALFRDALTDLIIAILSDEPTVIAAAQAAVADALAAQRIVQSRIVAPTGGQWTDLNLVDAALPVALDVRAGALNRPVSIALTGWHIPSAGTNATQILTTVEASPRQWTRARTGGVWSVWAAIARLTDIAVKCVHLEAGVWVWDGPNAPAATHYLIPDEHGVLIARTTPFPTPSAATPALDW